MSTERMYDVHQRDPKEALELSFARSREIKGHLFCWCSVMGICGETRYGRYRTVSRQELATRQHQIELWDCAISIHFTDVLHDPKTRKSVTIST